MKFRAVLCAAVVAAALLPVGTASAAISLLGYVCCYKVAAGSMKPTLKIGQVFGLVKYSSDKPQRGDIVLFHLPKDPATDYIKRLVGLPGDRVQMIDGALHLNGAAVERERIEDFADTEDGKTTNVKRWRETLPDGVSFETLDLVENGFYDNTQLFEVPEGHYFVLGDNRHNSSDSRILSQIGYVPAASIVGRMKRPGD